jgi:hypothetical protein
MDWTKLADGSWEFDRWAVRQEAIGRWQVLEWVLVGRRPSGAKVFARLTVTSPFRNHTLARAAVMRMAREQACTPTRRS